MRKWCSVRGIHGSEGRALRKIFKAKSAEPYIGKLAGNGRLLHDVPVGFRRGRRPLPATYARSAGSTASSCIADYRPGAP